MAPPNSRRSKRDSTTAPSIPLPGIALGLFAALAASFAASRALRKKRPSKSLEDEQLDKGSPSFEEKEIEIKERDDRPFLISSKGTITIAQEPSKLATGSLKPVFDAIEEVSVVHEGGTTPSEDEKDFRENGEIVDAGSGGDFEESEKGGETVERDKANNEEGEIAEVVLEIEATLAVDDASVRALQSSIREKGGGQGGGEAGRERIEGVESKVVVIEDKDVYGDGERGPTDQQPSPVLINGKKLDFSEEVPDINDETNLPSSENNSLSDGVSESSVQEVSSAPVRPFVTVTEEFLEAEKPRAKPGHPSDLNQSGVEMGSPEDDKGTLIKLGSPSAVVDVKGDSKDSEGKPSIRANCLDEGIAESTTSNTQELCITSSSSEEFNDCESVGECEHAAQSTREESTDDLAGLQDKDDNSVDCVPIDSKCVPLEEVPDNVAAMTTDKTNFQKEQEGTDSTNSDVQRNPELLSASEWLGNKTRVCPESDDVYDGESADGKACLECDISEEGASAENILKEPKPQPGTQSFDNADGTPAADNVKLEQEQPNLPVASKGMTNGSELSSDGRFSDKASREEKVDRTSGKLMVEDRFPAMEQDVEMTTLSSKHNDCMCEEKVQTSLMDSARVTCNQAREADGFLLKGAAHQHGLQPNSRYASKAFEYRSLEIGFFCLMIALLSYVVWYLEILPAVSQLLLTETS